MNGAQGLSHGGHVADTLGFGRRPICQGRVDSFVEDERAHRATEFAASSPRSLSPHIHGHFELVDQLIRGAVCGQAPPKFGYLFGNLLRRGGGSQHADTVAREALPSAFGSAWPVFGSWTHVWMR